MASPDVLISIVNHENREMLRKCLLSLPAATGGIRWRVTVVDNASADGSVEMLSREFPEVAIIANRTRMGFSANHNQVLRHLLAHPTEAPRYVLILNDDTTLEPAAVSRMVAMLDENPAMAAVVPTIVDLHGRPAPSRLAYPTAGNAWRFDWTDRTEPPDPGGFLQGCSLLVRVAAISRVGLFDEQFFLFYEDTDLSRRLADAGWSLGVCPEAVVVHVGHASVFKPGLAEFTPLQGRRSRYLYLRKHHGRARAELITALGRVLLLIRAARAAAGATQRHDSAGWERARRLAKLARLNPRRSVEAR